MTRNLVGARGSREPLTAASAVCSACCSASSTASSLAPAPPRAREATASAAVASGSLPSDSAFDPASEAAPSEPLSARSGALISGLHGRIHSSKRSSQIIHHMDTRHNPRSDRSALRPPPHQSEVVNTQSALQLAPAVNRHHLPFKEYAESWAQHSEELTPVPVQAAGSDLHC